MCTTRLGRWLCMFFVVAASQYLERSEAADIKVLSIDTVQPVLIRLAEAFQQDNRHRVALSFGIQRTVRQKFTAGEPADVVIMTKSDVEKLTAQRLIVAGTQTEIARIGIGVAVRQGAARPDISTPQALKQTLLSAKSLVIPSPALNIPAGIHLESVLRRLEIYEPVFERTYLAVSSQDACGAVARGEFALCAGWISELLSVNGITIVGPLSKELQKINGYSAGVVARSTAPKIARDFITFLVRPSSRSQFAKVGLDYRE